MIDGLSTGRVVLRGGVVMDGTGAEPAAADVLVAGGRILDVGVGLDADRAIDCAGAWISPGFIDAHVHVCIDHVDLMRHMEDPFSLRFYVAAKNLAALRRIGVTYVRDAAGADLGIKTALARGIIPGPRLQIAVTMLSQTGGHGDGWMPSGSCAPTFGSGEYPGCPAAIVDGIDAMRVRVRELVRAGADVIKVAASGGVMSPRDDPRHPQFSLAELQTAVEEAARAALPVMAHAQSTDGIKNAVRAGVRSVEHGVFLDEEAVDLMLAHGTFLVPTLMAPQSVLEAAASGDAVGDTFVDKARDVVAAHRRSFALAAEAGVRIAMGTDAVGIPQGRNLEELGHMVELGLRPVQAHHAATGAAAQLLGIADEVGTVTPGKRADLVVVAGDPLDLSGLAQRVQRVFMDGVQVEMPTGDA
jgi:imidazolonepropionase-like amidohydrolase